MELEAQDLTAAEGGEHVRIQAYGHTFYLLSEEAYDRFGRVDHGVMSRQEMDLLADEAHALIAEGETDEY